MEEREHRSVSEKIMVNGRILEDINLNYNKTPEGRSLIGNINKMPVFVRFPLIQQKTYQKRKATLTSKRKAKRDSKRKAKRKTAKYSSLR